MESYVTLLALLIVLIAAILFHAFQDMRALGYYTAALKMLPQF